MALWVTQINQGVLRALLSSSLAEYWQGLKHSLKGEMTWLSRKRQYEVVGMEKTVITGSGRQRNSTQEFFTGGIYTDTSNMCGSLEKIQL